jgi:O-antigen/teichoic acid export membrane protein
MDRDLAIARDPRPWVMRGLAWSAALAGTVQVTRILTGLVLVRLLAPHDYGLAGMVLLFSSLVLAISDVGLGAGLIKQQSISEEDRSTAFWTSAAVGTLLMTLAITCAGLVAEFFHEPGVRPLLMVMSVSFLATSLGMTQNSLFQRAMNFRAMSLRMMIAIIGGALVAIVIAALGGGAWALVGQQVTVSVLSTLFLWLLSSWVPSFTFSKESLRRLGSFGLPLLGSNLLNYTQANADNILVGRYIGSAALGVYSVSYNVILLPLQRLFGPIQETLFPALSRLQNDMERLSSLWVRVVRIVTAAVAPVMLGLIVVAPDFVDSIMGARWHDAVPVIRILALVTLMQSVNAVGERTLAVLGKVGIVFRFAILRTVLAIGAFVVGLHWGIVGVAAAYTAAMIPTQIVLTLIVTHQLSISRRAFYGGLAGVVEAALGMFFATWAARELMVRADLAPALRLLAVVLLGVAVYFPLLYWRSPAVLKEFDFMVRRRGALPD